MPWAINLRPTQQDALAKIRAAYAAGHRRVLLCAHTAFGKSTLTGTMLNSSRKSVLYLVHRAELMERAQADLTEQGIPFGVIEGNRAAAPHTYRVHIGMPQTIAKRLDKLPRFDWVISDEAHLAMSASWASVLHHYRNAWHLGMSATPCRLDGKPLGAIYDIIVYGPTIRESTDWGYLARARVFAPPCEPVSAGMSLDGQAALLNKPAITGSAIAEMRKRAPDRQFMAFCADRKHAEDVAAAFREAGISAIAVDSTMRDRRERIRDFEAGRAQGIVNVDLLTTGYDYKPVSLGIFLRHTESLALYLQMAGRFVRTAPGKDSWFMHDHVGLVQRHGMPDADREWTLEGREKRAAGVSVRQCGDCYAVFVPAPRCPECGKEIAVSAKRGAIKTKPGELAEVTGTEPAQSRAAEIKAALKGASSERDFVAVAERFGYKPGWAFRMREIYTANRRRAA